jgi:hypothetical protein
LPELSKEILLTTFLIQIANQLPVNLGVNSKASQFFFGFVLLPRNGLLYLHQTRRRGVIDK